MVSLLTGSSGEVILALGTRLSGCCRRREVTVSRCSNLVSIPSHGHREEKTLLKRGEQGASLIPVHVRGEGMAPIKG